MKPQRYLAFAMVALQAAVIEHMLFQLEWFPIAVATLALIGAPGWIALPLTRTARIVAALLLAVVIYAGMNTGALTFLVAHRLPIEPIFGGYAHVIAWVLLTLQAASFLLHPRQNGLSAYFPAFGVATLLAAGASGRHGSLDPGYHFGVLAFVGLMVAYWAVEPKQQAPRERASGFFTGLLIQGGVLFSALAVSFAASIAVGTYRNEIDRAVFSMVPGLMPVTAIGFSTQARLDSVARVREKNGDAVALRVFSKAPPGYLRGRAYDRYANDSWNVTAEERSLARSKERPAEFAATPQRPVFQLRNASAPYSALSINSAVQTEGCLFLPLESVLVAPGEASPKNDANGNVTVPSNAPVWEYMAWTSPASVSEPLREDLRGRFLALPENVDPAVRALAAQIFASCTTTTQKTAAVVAYFSKNYTYEFGIQVPSGKDPLTYFLLEHPPAHCEYFASGAAILLRLGGVPCRYVTGFVAAERNDIGGYWMARNRDAHAWVEAYDDADGTWRTVEPTVAAGVPGSEPSPRGGVFTHAFDAVRYLFARIAETIEGGRLRDALATALAYALRWIAPPAALIAIAAGLAFALRKRRRKTIDSERRRCADPNMDALLRLRAEVDKAVWMAVGGSREPQETVLAFADRMEMAPNPYSAPGEDEFVQKVCAWYREYSELRFSGQVTKEKVDGLRARREVVLPRKVQRGTAATKECKKRG